MNIITRRAKSLSVNNAIYWFRAVNFPAKKFLGKSGNASNVKVPGKRETKKCMISREFPENFREIT